MCGASSSGGVHLRGARRTGAVGVRGAAGVRVLAVDLALDPERVPGPVGAGAVTGAGAGIPCTQVDRGRSHISQ